MQLLRLHQHYQNGMLPYGGGIFNQPHLYSQAMEVIDERTGRILMERSSAKELRK